MKSITFNVLLALILGGLVFLFAEDAAKDFVLTSTAFKNGGSIPLMYSCKGKNRSPELSWSGSSDAKSFALLCMDPDAPGGHFIHWMLYNIPPSTHHLSESIERLSVFPDSSLHGRNSFNHIGYDGPCPPPNQKHHYVFTLFALDRTLELNPGSTYDEFRQAISGHVVDKAELTGTFGP